MTQVDFHVNVPDKIAYGCRLIRKIRQAGSRAVVFSDDALQLEQFDRALWSFAPLEFIPHLMASDALADRTPVLLTDRETDTPHHEVLVNLGSTTPAFFARFERLLEVVSRDDADRAQARARYRYYKDRGYPLNTHEIAR
jgi:DNA polymerase III subunit chi